jgi:hypothetical protein
MAVISMLSRLKGNFVFPKTSKGLDFYGQIALLSHLEREAYRAHLTRRVKPVSRRTRIKRPLYARPRPPTAPLAPPVA